MSLPIYIFVNDGQNKFEVHISKNMAKLADFRPKIGQEATEMMSKSDKKWPRYAH